MILAIAILAGTFMVLGELVRIGTRAGGDARDLTEAQLICESILSEVVSGAVEPDPVNRAEVPTDPAWLYSIWLQATDEEGLVALRVTVEQNLPKKKRPRSFSLTRWIPDPGIELPEEDERDDPSIPEEENDGSGSEAGGGGDGDGGSGGGSGGGR